MASSERRMHTRIAIFGTGYVGLVTAACLADAGHEVTCIDIDHRRLTQISGGDPGFHEPGLAEIVSRNIRQNRLRLTTDAAEAVANVEVAFIAVGTPMMSNGAADLSAVFAVSKTIAGTLQPHTIVAIKSTVPVGTNQLVRKLILQELSALGKQVDFSVCSNPEFLKEGDAISDFTRPDRIIVGTDCPDAANRMRNIYAPFCRKSDKVMIMSPASAELTKYASNAMLATKVSLMNEMARISEAVGADVDSVRRGMGCDPRIGYEFLFPGCGYGGSCFPKDIRALAHTAEGHGVPALILRAVDNVNAKQKHWLFEQVSAYFGAGLRGKRIAIWGLSFKPNTSDMREAPSRALMESLWAAGASVVVHDPEAMNECAKLYPDKAIEYADSPLTALKDAAGLAICTEWSLYRGMDPRNVAKELGMPLVFDGRNLWNPTEAAAAGLRYISVGRLPAGDIPAGDATQEDKPLDYLSFGAIDEASGRTQQRA